MALLFKGLSDNVEEWRRELTRRIPDLDMRIWPDVGDPADIDVAFTWQAPHGEFKRYPNLRAILNLGVGVDTLLTDPDLPRHVPVARMVDPSLTRQMTTYLLHAVIHYHRRFDHFAALQREASWKYERGRNNGACRVGIMGMGVLGGDAAQALRGLGFAVAGWSRTAKSIAGIEGFHGADGLTPFLARTDILCCILPLTAGTRGIINADLLRRLPRGTRFVNISRGAVVIEPDLLAALDLGHIGAAMLDVFTKEPLPADSPFWRHPRVVVTPHVAGNTTPATAADQVAENIRRARAGQRLLNQVDLDVGY
ncbi:MAG: glyoxylate/hydroxypyruvate reductase A [Alphaproteobacteria bacterium]|nr:glyoxylate/hydroxypyruvate reductase A [Alphaproteobacteria bacterium]